MNLIWCVAGKIPCAKLHIDSQRCDPRLKRVSAQIYSHSHMVQHVRRSPVTSADRRHLEELMPNGNRHQVEATDAAIGRIEGDPASVRHKDFRPGMGGLIRS